jgi:hypothetical protein
VLGSTAEGFTTHAITPVLIIRAATAPTLSNVRQGQSAWHTA